MATQGDRLKNIRQALNLSQDEFGDIFNIQKQMVSSLEKDKLKLNNDKLVKLLNDYNVNINYLLNGHGKMFINNPSSIGERIEYIQLQKNISIAEMAKEINVSTNTLIDVINNKINPDINMLCNIKQKFQTSIDWIMYGD